MNPNFPIYIPSKSRWETRLTVKALEDIKVPYKIIIEEQEYKQYKSVIDKKNILILDKKYQEEYNPCDNLGDKISKGSGPARNFAWEHSISEGYKWHWIMDDNIRSFQRLNKNRKIRVADGTIFRCMEDFVLRYENISMAGPHYIIFVPRKDKITPLVLNSRIYSCNFIRNDLPYRWKGRFNEDTILSMRMLKDGWCTVLFRAFLQQKQATQSMEGGNTEVYKKYGTYAKSLMLAKLFPEETKIIWRFGRWHHYIDYKKYFHQKLIKKKGVEIKEKINDYGMKLKKIK